MSVEDLSSKASNLSGLITYQPGSAVSRQLIKESNGNVTLFAFDKGEGLSEHTAPCEALVYILDGPAEITISGQSAPCLEGH